MESEENLSREKQNSEQNISEGNSSSLKNTAQKPLKKQSKSQPVISPEHNQQISSTQTKSFIAEEFSIEIFCSEFCFSLDRFSSDSIFQKLQLSFRFS